MAHLFELLLLELPFNSPWYKKDQCGKLKATTIKISFHWEKNPAYNRKLLAKIRKSYQYTTLLLTNYLKIIKIIMKKN